jgi:hypothetical protein
MDFSVHQLGHELSGVFDVSHGASLSSMWTSWAKYAMGTDIPRFAKYARDVWGVIEADDQKAAEEGIKKTTGYFKSLDMPVSLSGLGLGAGTFSDETIETLADRCVFFGARKVGTFKVLDKDDIIAIYKSANF